MEILSSCGGDQEGVTGRSRDMGWGVGGGLRILNEFFGSEKFKLLIYD